MPTLEQEIDTLARTIWGEARGEGIAGMSAVASVIMNRAADPKRWGNNVTAVTKQPLQFSAWNKNDPNYALMQKVTDTDTAFKQAKEIARKALNDELPDKTKGANHYHTKAIKPKWADDKKRTVTLGNHHFYKL